MGNFDRNYEEKIDLLKNRAVKRANFLAKGENDSSNHFGTENFPDGEEQNTIADQFSSLEELFNSDDAISLYFDDNNSTVGAKLAAKKQFYVMEALKRSEHTRRLTPVRARLHTASRYNRLAQPYGALEREFKKYLGDLLSATQ